MKKRKIIYAILISLASLLLIQEGVFLLTPTLHVYHPTQVEIYDRNDKYLYSSSKSGPFKYLYLNEVPQTFKELLILSEDKNFYSHAGFDFLRLIKSGFLNLSHGEIVSGGSTISSQLARLLYLNNDKTIERKLKESYYTRLLERSFTKDEILELYINSVYFGKNLYGLNSAVNYYFDKIPSLLTLSEQAFLISLLPHPNLSESELTESKLQSRVEKYLFKLFENDLITSEMYYHESSRPLKFKIQNGTLNHPYAFFENGLVSSLSHQNHKVGIKVKTTLDANVQEVINETLSIYNNEIVGENIAVVVLKPGTSDILGLSGGLDYEEKPFNYAISSEPLIGSTFKPLLYTIALDYGLTPLTELSCLPTSFEIEGIGNYSPHNNNDQYSEVPLKMVEAIGASDNIYAVKTSLLLGSDKIQNRLKDFFPGQEFNPTSALGNLNLSPLKLAALYNAIASDGVYYEPTFFTEYQELDSKVIRKKVVKKKQLFSKLSSSKMTHLLKAPFDNNLTSYAKSTLHNYAPVTPFGGKSGSTPYSSWAIGINPHYTICVYIGSEPNTNLTNYQVSKKVFKRIADKLMEKKESTYFKVPSSLRAFKLHNNETNKDSEIYYY